MRIQTFSIVAGSMACNGRCPFCVAGMTPRLGVTDKEPEVNWRNFKRACLLAKQSGATTAMITSKGEPTLFPEQVTKFLAQLEKYDFPLIELQTNAIKFYESNLRYKQYLQCWYEKGLTTIAISIVHYLPEKNREVYLPYKEAYIDLPFVIRMLHDIGFSVRLTCIAAEEYIDSANKLCDLIAFTRENKVEQLTITPVNKTEHIDPDPQYQKIQRWTELHQLSMDALGDIKKYLNHHGSEIMRLAHGAVVYDINGQNVCLNNCLTVQPDNKELRNLIFFPDGHVRTHWQFSGSIIF